MHNVSTMVPWKPLIFCVHCIQLSLARKISVEATINYCSLLLFSPQCAKQRPEMHSQVIEMADNPIEERLPAHFEGHKFLAPAVPQ